MHQDEIRIGDAADLLGVSRSTITRYIDAGEIAVARTLPGGHRRLSRPSVLALAARMGMTQPVTAAR